MILSIFHFSPPNAPFFFSQPYANCHPPLLSLLRLLFLLPSPPFFPLPFFLFDSLPGLNSVAQMCTGVGHTVKYGNLTSGNKEIVEKSDFSLPQLLAISNSPVRDGA